MADAKAADEKKKPGKYFGDALENSVHAYDLVAKKLDETEKRAPSATKIAGRTPSSRSDAFLFTLKEPVGVVAAIVPWNFPFLLSSWKVAPALAAGCCVILKPASQPPLTAVELGRIGLDAGLPPGVLQVLPGSGSVAGVALVRHAGVDKVSFTGSVEVGRTVVREAAGTLKRVTVELGGKSPKVVFADADVEAALRGAFNGIFYNKAEVCAAGSRLLVERSVQFLLSLKPGTAPHPSLHTQNGRVRCLIPYGAAARDLRAGPGHTNGPALQRNSESTGSGSAALP